MKTYTSMSDEGIEAVIEALPFKYPMELNRRDMENLVVALAHTYNTIRSEERSDWCQEFISSIATTLEIEFV